MPKCIYMVEDLLTNIYFRICGNRKNKEFNPKEKLSFHPHFFKNKNCSNCCEHIYYPEHISKIWKKFHVFCNTNCYHDWLNQFN